VLSVNDIECFYSDLVTLGSVTGSLWTMILPSKRGFYRSMVCIFWIGIDRDMTISFLTPMLYPKTLYIILLLNTAFIIRNWHR
jgi:hypothetical protein